MKRKMKPQNLETFNNIARSVLDRDARPEAQNGLPKTPRPLKVSACEPVLIRVQPDVLARIDEQVFIRRQKRLTGSSRQGVVADILEAHFKTN